MTVWDATHPQPESGEAFERKLCRQLADASQKQLDALVPKNTDSLAKWREVVGGAFETIIGGSLPAKSDLEIVDQQVTQAGNSTRYLGLLRVKSRGQELPVVLLQPGNWNGRAVIWLSEQGKSALFGDDGSP